MNIISVAELAASVRETIADTNPSAVLFVGLANDLVTEVVGDGAAITATMRAITLGAAKRAWINPRGTSSVTKSFDDASRTDRWEGRAAKPNDRAVYLTDDEKADLKAEVDTDRTPDVGTIYVGTRWGVPC